MDAGMGNDFTSSPIQLRGFAEGEKQAPAVGPEASARPGLEVRRMTGADVLSFRMESAEWKLPSRRKIGLLALILTETALFSIFVAAYGYYIGKSLTGPYPKDVLELPIVATICVLSCGVTLLLAVCAFECGVM